MSKHHDVSRSRFNRFKFDTGKLSVVATIFLPVLIETALSQFYNVVDMMMVGRDNPDGLAAIGLTSNPLSIFLSIFSAVNVGTTTLVAWHVGAKKLKDAQDVSRTSLWMNLFLGIIMTLFGMLMAEPIVYFMGGDEEVMRLAVDYYDILVVGTTFQALTYSVTAAMRGAGLSKVPMIYNTVSNLLNVGGNYVLIYGKFGFRPMGVIGAGYSTLISRIICCIWALLYMFFAKTPISFRTHYGKYRFSWSQVRQMLRIGIPTAVETLIMNCGSMLFVKIVNMLGKVAFSTHQICGSLNGFISAPATALSVTSNTVVGQYLGAGEFDTAKKYNNYLCKTSFLLSVVMTTLINIFWRPLIGCYATADQTEIIALAHTIFIILSIQYLTGYTNGVLMGTMRGAGDTRFAMLLNTLGFFCFRIPLSYLFGITMGWGLEGIWLALIAHSWLNTICLFLRYRSGRWIETFKRTNAKG